MSAAPSTPFDAANRSRARLDIDGLWTASTPRSALGGQRDEIREIASPGHVGRGSAASPPASAIRAAKASRRSARRASYFADTVSTSGSVHALSNSALVGP